MTTQTVVFTPNRLMTTQECLNYIGFLLPVEVLRHLSSTEASGSRSITKTDSNNTHTVVTTWHDNDDKETFKTLMSSVSAGVISRLESEGWTITFTPLTVDL